jgi:hypothetical protein
MHESMRHDVTRRKGNPSLAERALSRGDTLIPTNNLYLKCRAISTDLYSLYWQTFALFKCVCRLRNRTRADGTSSFQQS